MIYELRVYTILPGKMRDFIQAFSDIPVRLFEKHGARLIGAWQPSIGQNNQFTYILGFKDLADQERFWNDFRQDPELRNYLGGTFTSHINNSILRPVPGSPLQ